jgi:hypothetical protein
MRLGGDDRNVAQRTIGRELVRTGGLTVRRRRQQRPGSNHYECRQQQPR